ncbi:MAG TPA: tripartite tricarboxylate transporter TctB family protein [Candidatus Lachnoclostridium stercoravium]|uniref:Tripartite tricarboxylate transporter TctB family protein n=1 Tax=Candidatus Lachnoclostridium stercoravium TaxID=2838633 RepID=A0A9D2HIS5_9FIRM|nr:tripartite tricarboxylate transporter TctB family protein [Candidatus Lachnoclostridium stercoravium]
MGTNQIKKCTSDIISSLVLLFFLITLTVQLGAIPEESSTYPKILMGLSYIMVVIQLIRNVLKYKNSELVETQALEQAKFLIPYGILVVVYLFLLNKIGYIFDTVLFCVVSLIGLRLKNKAVIVILPIVFTLLIYFVFSLFLSVILPRGSWISLNL